MLKRLQSLPWQHQIIVVVGSCFIFYVIIYLIMMLMRPSPPPQPSPITLGNAPQQTIGMLDPALAFTPDGQSGFMALTLLERDLVSNQTYFNIALARAGGRQDRAWDWSYTNSPFTAKSDTLIAPDGSSILAQGIWRHETPGLVYVPDDPGREWKIFTYKYFWPDETQSNNTRLAQRFSVIAYKESADPRYEWSEETWLFAADPEYPPFPYNQLIKLHLNRLHPSLQNVVSYARPSVIYKQGALLMTLSAFEGQETPARVILIASTDKGRSWAFLNTLLTQQDAKDLGFESLSGATLTEHQGNLYLLATFGTQSLRNYGVHVLGFQDIARGTLLRDPVTKAPRVLSALPPVNDTRRNNWGGGFGVWHDSFAGQEGLLMPEMDNNRFIIMRTRKNLLEND